MSESLAAIWRTGGAALASRLPLQRQASETQGGGGGHRRERESLVALALRPAEMRAQHNAATNALQVLDRRQRLLEASCVSDGASGFVLPQGGIRGGQSAATKRQRWALHGRTDGEGAPAGR